MAKGYSELPNELVSAATRFCEARLLPSAGYLCVPFWFAAIAGLPAGSGDGRVPVRLPVQVVVGRVVTVKPGCGLWLAQ